MPFEFKPLGPLANGCIGESIFQDWLKDGIRLPGTEREISATGELAASLEFGDGVEESENSASPLFGGKWKVNWEKELSQYVDGESEVLRFREIGNMLATGECDVVVTGQQPGFLGGPLYTLYKIATTIALAKRRTAAGRPTIPVFWSADDDDDGAEAMSSLFWQPGETAPRQVENSHNSQKSGSQKRPLPVGEFSASVQGVEAAQWLAGLADSDPGKSGQPDLATDLAKIWESGVQQSSTWSLLQAQALTRIFSGCDLVIVSGNDSTLHEAAAPIYQLILGNSEELSALARQQGDDFAKSRWHAQIGGRSLAKPIFFMDGGRRSHLPSGEVDVEPGLLRPGVLFRSLVQDWLLRPAGVVVGPGELAYLKQLDPLYKYLGIPRSPLVPRLFGWVGPTGMDPGLLTGHGDSGRIASARLEELADGVARDAQDSLFGVLSQSLNLDSDRAQELAHSRARRFRKGVLSLLSGEADRQLAAEIPPEPVWVFPQGERQERRLASFCAAAIWGQEWVDTILAAAEDHLEKGLGEQWSEYFIEV